MDDPVVYKHTFDLTDGLVDCFGDLKVSSLLYVVQEMGGMHCNELALDYDTLAAQRLFWAVTRHRVQITRLPQRGEKLYAETWPMPTTRVAYPRSVVTYDADGNECFRAVSLWCLMNLDTRAMILPGKSGIVVAGTLRGNELPAPTGVISRDLVHRSIRSVCFTDLDRNGHMNNTRYMDWIDDLFPSEFHHSHKPREFTACYLSETREGDVLDLRWDRLDGSSVQTDAYRGEGEDEHRVFTARILYD